MGGLGGKTVAIKVETIEALIENWNRQKNLFPVLDCDGWMDQAVNDIATQLANHNFRVEAKKPNNNSEENYHE